MIVVCEVLYVGVSGWGGGDGGSVRGEGRLADTIKRHYTPRRSVLTLRAHVLEVNRNRPLGSGD